MKPIGFLLASWILLNCTAVTGAQEIEKGFLGIPWQSDVHALKGMTRVGESGAVAYYTNPNEIHQLYDQNVPGVIYGFYKNALFAVFIKIDSLEMLSRIRQQLTSRYGDPAQSFSARTEQTIYKWKSGDVKIKLKLSDSENSMKLVFYYSPLSDKVSEDDLEAEQRRSPHLFPIKKGKVPEVVPLFEF